MILSRLHSWTDEARLGWWKDHMEWGSCPLVKGVERNLYAYTCRESFLLELFNVITVDLLQAILHANQGDIAAATMTTATWWTNVAQKQTYKAFLSYVTATAFFSRYVPSVRSLGTFCQVVLLYGPFAVHSLSPFLSSIVFSLKHRSAFDSSSSSGSSLSAFWWYVDSTFC